jgi:hypothetical protein
MSINVFVNNLIQWIPDPDNTHIDRVLWVDDGYKIAFVIDIHSESALPRQISVSEIEEAIKSSSAIKISKDPWIRIAIDGDISDKDKAIRNNNWEVIASIVSQEPSIYYRDRRGALISELIEGYNANLNEDRYNLTKRSVYKYLRRYWQRGKNLNALLPDYKNCGGEGKPKLAGDKKRGRPRKYAHDPKIGTGMNVSEETKMTMRVAYSQFYHTQKRRSLTAAYEKMIQEYYCDEETINNDVLDNSKFLMSEIPTLRQFKYWYQVENKLDFKKKVVSRYGKNKYEQEYRPILSNSTAEVIGPGARYQVDATVADVYLVSSYNRNWIIGRPVIYVVLDVFSRMIVGVYVGLEGPSWLGMMMALENTTKNKVKYCEEYGVEIIEDDWPCHHLPQTILGDRGELISNNAKSLIENLDVKIENAAPFRPDWKGIVERRFKIINEKVKPFIPGSVDIDFNKRGGKDYRLDSKIDIRAFNQIVINMILYHNNQHMLSDYPRTVEIIKDEIQPIPRDLWQWGIINYSGKLRTVDSDLIKLNLMPKGNATITEKGIKFKGLYYTCDPAEQEMWFSRARGGVLSKSEKKIEVSYDPRSMDYVYIPAPGGRSYIKCSLVESHCAYKGRDLYDIAYKFAEEEYQKQKHSSQQLKATVDLNIEIERIVDRETEITDAAKDSTLSKRERIGGIREHRSNAKENLRNQELFELPHEKDKTIENDTDRSLDKPTLKEDRPSLKPSYHKLLRSKREQIKNEKNK